MNGVIELQDHDSTRPHNSLHFGDHVSLRLQTEQVQQIQRCCDIKVSGGKRETLGIRPDESYASAALHLLRSGDLHVLRSIGSNGEFRLLDKVTDAASRSAAHV
jgi:hypothetical protein